MAVFEPAVQRAIERANALAKNGTENNSLATANDQVAGESTDSGAVTGGSGLSGSTTNAASQRLAHEDHHSMDMALDMALDHAIDGNFDSSIEKILKARFGLDQLRPKQK